MADLSAAFKGQATSVKRGITMPERKQVLVQDEVDGVAKGKSIRWNLITRARIGLSKDGKTATFEYNEQTLTAKLLVPGKATFKATDATTKLDIENQNKGYSRLIVDIPSTGKPLTIAVQFTPGKSKAPDLKPKPLSKWAK